MIITIDIGNSTISAGFFEGEGLRKRINLNNRDIAGFAKALRRISKKEKIDDAMLSSVVPSITDKIKTVVRRETGVTAREIEPEKFGLLSMKYGNPKGLGADRLIGAYAVKVLYGFPSVLVDAGTATTLSIIDDRGRFAGGMIDAGIGIRFSALKNCGAKLKKIKLIRTTGLIGSDTNRCVSSALINGTALALESVVSEISGKFKKKTRNIITGGFSKLIYPRLKSFVLDTDIVLKGLNLACMEPYKNNDGKKR